MLFLKNYLLYFSICLSLPSILLYIAEVLTIIRHKSLHNSFYALFCMRAFNGFLYILDSYYGYRIPNLFPNWFLANPYPEWTFSTFIFFTHYSLLGDNLASICIMLNRFTAIALPTKHQTIWKKINLFACFLIFILPLNAIGMLNINCIYLVQRDEKNESIISIDITERENEGKLNYYIKLSTIESIFFLCIFILINLMIVFAYKQRLKKQVGVLVKNLNEGNKKDQIERKLWFFALFTSSGQMLIAIIVICIYIANLWNLYSIQSVLGSIYSIIMDLGIVVMPSWLLIWASQTFRIKLIQTFLPEKIHKKIIGTMTQSSKMIQNGHTTIKVLPSNLPKI